MKFCAKCGMQMEVGAEKCPQCNSPVFDPLGIATIQHKSPKKRKNSLLIIVPITMFVAAITTVAIMCLLLPKDFAKNTSETNIVRMEVAPTTEEISYSTEPAATIAPIMESIFNKTEASNSGCPAQEYGNHSWSKAHCTEPSKCYACGVYKDEKLGNHSWHVATCIEPMQCGWCNEYKNEELGHHEFVYDEDIEEVVCLHCHLLRVEYDVEKK